MLANMSIALKRHNESDHSATVMVRSDDTPRKDREPKSPMESFSQQTQQVLRATPRAAKTGTAALAAFFLVSGVVTDMWDLAGCYMVMGTGWVLDDLHLPIFQFPRM